MKKFLDDILILIGCVLVVYGVSLIYIPAAWITAGILFVAFGVLFGIGNEKNTNKEAE